MPAVILLAFASTYALVAASVALTGVGMVTVPVNEDVPAIDRFPPMYILLLTPTPPGVIMLPVVMVVASVVNVVVIAPELVSDVRVPTLVIWIWEAFTDNVDPVLVNPVPAVM